MHLHGGRPSRGRGARQAGRLGSCSPGDQERPWRGESTHPFPSLPPLQQGTYFVVLPLRIQRRIRVRKLKKVRPMMVTGQGVFTEDRS